MTRKCIVCDAVLKYGQKKYCSKKCQYEGSRSSNNPMWKNRKLKGKCNECKKEFEYYESTKSGKYCSLECCCKSEEWREKQRKAKLGKKLSNETKKKMSEIKKGKKKSSVWVAKIVETRKKNYDRIGRKTEKYLLERNSNRYKDFRSEIFKRDKYTCQKCFDSTGGNLELHHKISFSFLFLERKIVNNNDILYEKENAVTLCKTCHKKTINYAKKLNNQIEYKLYDKMRLLWEQAGKSGAFENYYIDYMERIIDRLKERLT